jgi:3-hydroxy-9,10-secoandrosta-1,3,5(10)-triene-9,17-dione monooxygenase reductase component
MSDPTQLPEANSVPFDSKHFRTVLGHFPTGVTVVTGMAAGDRPHGFTIGSFTSVSLDPPLVGFLPQTDSETWMLMADAGSFCVNVLSDKQSDLCWKFAKSGTEAARFDGVEWHAAPSGAPVLERAVAWIDCQVEEVYEMGDHFFVLGRVTSLDADADHDGLPPQPLVFYRGTIGGFAAEG